MAKQEKTLLQEFTKGIIKEKDVYKRQYQGFEELLRQ